MAASPLKTDAEIARLRVRIDELDRRLVLILARRGALAGRIGRLRQASRRGRRDMRREREILARVRELNAGRYPWKSLRAIYREILSATRGLETADRPR